MDSLLSTGPAKRKFSLLYIQIVFRNVYFKNSVTFSCAGTATIQYLLGLSCWLYHPHRSTGNQGATNLLNYQEVMMCFQFYNFFAKIVFRGYRRCFNVGVNNFISGMFNEYFPTFLLRALALLFALLDGDSYVLVL